MLRSYKCDAKYHDLKQKLERGRTDFDLYSIVDETRGRADIPDVNVVWHSLAACRALGLSHDHPALLYACSDLPFYFALRELPRYKHYILIEDDVDMVSGDATFLNEVARLLSGRPELDLVALLFHEHAEKKGWYNACSKIFPQRTWHFAYFHSSFCRTGPRRICSVNGWSRPLGTRRRKMSCIVKRSSPPP